ncbi:hypothetical protein KBB12_02915 [Candidatus Woesebacteria bacterium]|nr:hypothetical protein [Candidatus Woesebacteria bacterium]
MTSELPAATGETLSPTRHTFRLLDVPPSYYRVKAGWQADQATGLLGLTIIPPSEFGAPLTQSPPETLPLEVATVIEQSVSMLRDHFHISQNFPGDEDDPLLDVETECQRVREFGEVCARADTLITNRRDGEKLMYKVMAFHMRMRYGIELVAVNTHSEETLKSGNVMERLFDFLSSGELNVTMREALENMPSTLMWIISQEEYFLERGAKVPDKLQLTGTAMIHLAMALESAPEFYRGADHILRADYARALVFARDAHMRLIAPSLAGHTNAKLAEITGIESYGNRFYALAHHTPMLGFAKDIIGTCLQENASVQGAEWQDPEHTVMYESSAKGWWGIVENFVSKLDVQERIGSVASRLFDKSNVAEEGKRNRFRLANATVYADVLDNLVREHPHDPEIQTLLRDLDRFISQTPDHAGMRLVVGSNAWQTAYRTISSDVTNAGVNFAVTYTDGRTEPACYLPLSEVETLLTGGEISKHVDPPIQKLLEEIVRGIPPTLSISKKISLLLERWHEYFAKDGSHPFAAVFWRGSTTYASGQQAPTELQLSPYSIAPWNWHARGSYKDLDPNATAT